MAEEAEMDHVCLLCTQDSDGVVQRVDSLPPCAMSHTPTDRRDTAFHSGYGAGGSFHKSRTIMQVSSLYLYIKFLSILPEEPPTTYIFISLSNHGTPSHSGYFPGHLCLHRAVEGSYMTLIGHMGNASLTLFIFLSSH